MAVFLTVVAAEILIGRLQPGVELLGFFAAQMGVGALVGVGVGYLGARLINRVNLDAGGLYPVLASAIGAIAFGAAASLGGSGFLAVYLAGILIGNQPLVFRQGIFHFHDGAAWLAQILMFVLLGLLSFPSSLLAVAGPGILLALVLVFVARPLTVALTMLPFGFGARELTLLSWVGLKGAVPVILATYPLLLGLPEGRVIFDLVFFVVLVSALAQGWSLPLVARALRLERPAERAPRVSLELTALQQVDAEIAGFPLAPESRAAGERLADLPLPDGAVVAVVARESQVLPPGGDSRLREGDYVYTVATRDVQEAVERIFTARRGEPPARELPAFREFTFRAETTAGALRDFLGVELDVAPEVSLRDLLAAVGPGAAAGDLVERRGYLLMVRGVGPGGVERVGVRRAPATRGAPPGRSRAG
jgi:potassium/hydrogen antiporter